MKLKTCVRCGAEKSVDLFNRSKSSGDGFMSSCRACQIEMDRQRGNEHFVTEERA